VVVSGRTGSSDFPTTSGAYDQTYNGGAGDAYVAKLSSTGSTLLWATLLGGSADDGACSVAIAPSGSVVVVGVTYSANFPTTQDAYDRSWNGLDDAFVAVLSSTGSDLLESTYLGGASREPTDGASFTALATLDPSGNAIVTGRTSSPDFPTTPGAYDPSFNGSWDGFMAKLQLPSISGVPPGAAGSKPDGFLRAAPNPSSPTTEIRYSLKQDSEIKLDVCDVTGRRVTTLASGRQSSGDHRVSWNGRNEHGEPAASGIYFVRLQIGGSTHYARIARVE
jgi:hypothetical protein